MNRIFQQCVVALAILTTLCACAPVTDYNAHHLSTWELLTRNGDLQQYLARRREVLEGLGAKVDSLDSRIDDGLANLYQDRRSLGSANYNATHAAEDRVRAETALSKREAIADRVVSRIADLKSRVGQMREQSELAAADAQNEFDRVRQISNGEIPNIQADINSLQLGVENGLRRTQDGNSER